MMPVFNGETYLAPAVESILGQTFSDFELLVLNDGSFDRSLEIVASYHDPRIRLMDPGRHLGLSGIRNLGLDLARGTYLAFLDCDDVSLPQRLERQVAFLDAHPEIGACGAWVRNFGVGVEERTSQYPTAPDDLKCLLIFDMYHCFTNPAMMLRMGLVKRYGLRYDPVFGQYGAEDYDFWTRAVRHFPISNLPEVLLQKRLHPAQMTAAYHLELERMADRVRKSYLRNLGIEADDRDLDLHFRLLTLPPGSTVEFLWRARDWLTRLREANARIGFFPEPAFTRNLTDKWQGACHSVEGLGFWVYRNLVGPSLTALTPPGVLRYWEGLVRFFLRSVLRPGLPNWLKRVVWYFLKVKKGKEGSAVSRTSSAGVK